MIGGLSHGRDENILLITLGLSIVFDNTALLFFGGDSQTVDVPYAGTFVELGAAFLPVPKIISFVASLLICGALGLYMVASDTGKAIRAVAQERHGARLVGIDVENVFAISYGIGIACLGAAACLLMPTYYVAPTSGHAFVLVAFTIVVLGGMGSFVGAAVGGLIIGITESLGGLLLGEQLGQIGISLIFILILLLKPTGLFGSKAMSPRRPALHGAGLAPAILYPFLVPNYLVTVGMLILFTAFLGQSWNLSGGFAGQTSFGHVVFFGTGAYCSAILQVTYGWNPWLAWPVAMLAGAAVGWMIATLSFRAGLRGSYFALITLAFAEVFRILANSVPFTRGGLGMLIKADQRPANMQFKDPIWFYYLRPPDLRDLDRHRLASQPLTLRRASGGDPRERGCRAGARHRCLCRKGQGARLVGCDGRRRRRLLYAELPLCRSQHRLRRRQVGRDVAGQHGGRRRHHLRPADRGSGADRHQRIDALGGQRPAGTQERPAAQPDRLRRHADPASWPAFPMA